MPSKSKTSTSQRTTGTATTTPNVPGFISGPYQNYLSQVGGLFNQSAPQANSLQQQGWAGAANLGQNSGIGQGMDATRQLTGYTPDQVSAGQLSNTDLSPYMNPYQQNVIDASLQDFQNANGVGLNQLRASTPTGAFNGSRQGVAEGQLTSDSARNWGSMVAGLRSQNFGQAQDAARFDIGNRLSTDTNNADRNLAGAGFRLGAANQLYNQGTGADANSRANIATQMVAGSDQQQNTDPTAQRMNYLRQLQQLLSIDPSMFTGQTINQSGTANGTSKTNSSGLTFGWDPKGGFSFGVS